MLPLPKKGKRIAVLGFAGRSVFVGPAGSGSVVPTRLPSPLSAIARMLGHEDGTIPPRCCATRCTNASCPAECGELIYDVMTVGGPTNLTRAAMMAADPSPSGRVYSFCMGAFDTDIPGKSSRVGIRF